MKAISKQHIEHFPESFGRTSQSPERVIGHELKEVDPSCHRNALMHKLGLPCEGRLSSARVLPDTGLPMMLLGLIFRNSYRAPGEEIWGSSPWWGWMTAGGTSSSGSPGSSTQSCGAPRVPAAPPGAGR